MKGGAHERWFTCLNMRCDVRYYKTSATGEYEIVQRKLIEDVYKEPEATKSAAEWAVCPITGLGFYWKKSRP